MKQQKKRLRALKRKLDRQLDLNKHYHEFMREYVELNHMTEVQINKDQRRSEFAYYISDHAVMKEDSETTKVRVIFHVSCKPCKGTSP